DIKRFFVANIHEIRHLSPINSTQMIRNDYSKLKIINTLFNIGLIVDQILQFSFPNKSKKMLNAVYQLALDQGWATKKDAPDRGVFLSKIKPILNDRPDKVLPDLLNGNVSYDGSPVNAAEIAILIAYHLRNFGGHNIMGCDIMVDQYSEILEQMMYAFLLCIE